MNEKKKTLVIGASDNPSRYSYLAIKKLQNHRHPIVAIGKRKCEIDDIIIYSTLQPFENIDTVTLYLNPNHQKEYYDYILSLKPKRIIFNPGTENTELFELATQNNILAIEACTLVLLSTHQY
ncbi:MAG: CoA-binding protein [Chitinophagaceae bacterium]|nr:MAG: CoA-binding protein [Chitinophagaceae bacterium]